MTIDPDRLKEIAARVEEATHGPWGVAPRSDSDETADIVADYQSLPSGGCRAHWIAELDAGLDFNSNREDDIARMVADAEFIAHAREDIPYLLSALEASEARCRDAERANAEWLRDITEEIAERQRVEAKLEASEAARLQAERERDKMREYWGSPPLKDAPHKFNTRRDCPSWWDGCNCSVQSLSDWRQRALDAESRVKALEAQIAQLGKRQEPR